MNKSRKGGKAAEVKIEIGEPGSDRKARAEELIREVSEEAGARFEAIREDAGAYASRAGETIRGAADTGKSKAVEALHGIADVVRDVADRADEQGQAASAARFARKAADSMDRLSDVLKDKSLDDLGADVRTFVRERPAVAIGAAAVLGFALARMLKSSGRDDGDEA